jgi:hypothetical protein
VYYKYLLATVLGMCFCFTGVEAFALEVSSFQVARMSKIASSDSLSYRSSIDSQKISQTPTPVSPPDSSPAPTRPPSISPTPTHPPSSSPVTNVTLINKDNRDYDVNIVPSNSNPFIFIGGGLSKSNVCPRPCRIQLGSDPNNFIDASGNNKIIIENGHLRKE